MQVYDKIIVGAGLYGLYAAQKCGAAGQRVLVLEKDAGPGAHGLPLPPQLFHGHQERPLF